MRVHILTGSAIVALLALAACSEASTDANVDSPLRSTVWRFQSAGCASPSFLYFNSDGAGSLNLADCTGQCDPGQEAWFYWTDNGTSVSLTYFRSRICGEDQGDSPLVGSTDESAYTITGNQLQFAGVTWTRM